MLLLRYKVRNKTITVNKNFVGIIFHYKINKIHSAILLMRDHTHLLWESRVLMRPGVMGSVSHRIPTAS